jgi:hypothetical protein
MRITMACYVLTAAFHATSKSSMFERQNPLKGSIQGGNELDNVLVSSIHVFTRAQLVRVPHVFYDEWYVLRQVDDDDDLGKGVMPLMEVA